MNSKLLMAFKKIVFLSQVSLFAFFIINPSLVFAQNNVGIGTTTPRPQAILDLNANDKGLLFPRLTTAQRTALGTTLTGNANPADKGMTVFDIGDNKFYFWNGTAWAELGTGSGGGGSLQDAYDLGNIINTTSPVQINGNGGIGIGATGTIKYSGTSLDLGAGSATYGTPTLDQVNDNLVGVTQQPINITPAWQSFTAGVTGQLTQIDLGIAHGIATGNTTLRVYTGTGNSPVNEIYSQVISYNNALAIKSFALATPINVVAGQVYTIGVDIEGFSGVGYRTDNAYAAGQMSLGGANDMIFRTYVAAEQPAGVLSLNNSGNVGIGTTTPTAKLDVAGDLKLQNGVAINEFSSNTALGTSNAMVPTQNAVKTYVDGQISSLPGGLTGTFIKVATTNGRVTGSLPILVTDLPNFDAAKTTTGVFDVARIPDLDASKITTGTFPDARLADVGTAGTYTKVTTDAKGRVTSGTNLVAADIPNLDASKITTGTFGNARISDLAPSKLLQATANVGDVLSWDGAAWSPNDINNNFIQNQNIVNQSASFRISGNAQIGQRLLVSDTIAHIGNINTLIRFPINNRMILMAGGENLIELDKAGLNNLVSISNYLLTAYNDMRFVAIQGDQPSSPPLQTTLTTDEFMNSRDVATIEHFSNGFAGVSSGFGAGLLFKLVNTNKDMEEAVRINGRWQDGDDGNESSMLGFFTRDGGGALQERMTITNKGFVGINITNPNTDLHVNGSLQVANGSQVSDFSANTSLGTSDNVLPTQRAVKTYVDNAIASVNGIQNQNAVNQIADYRISGNGTMIGKLGVGIVANNYQAHIHNPAASDASLQITSNITGTATTDGLIVQVNAGGTNFLNRENTAMRFGTNAFDRMIITNDGRVGINTMTPGAAYHLEVNGKIKTFGIDENSDKRLKKDIVTIPNALEKVGQIRGVTYNWRKDEFPNRNFSDREQVGVIAQEIEKVLPQVVTTNEDGFKTVDYNKIVALLIEAIKEQQTQIAAQQSHINSLEQGIKTKADSSQIERLQEQVNTMQQQLFRLLQIVEVQAQNK